MTVTIELLEPRRAPDIQRMAAHPDIVATTRLPNPYPPDGAITFIEQTLRDRANDREYAFAIVANGHCVGSCGIKKVDRAAGQGEIGYWVGREHWGSGYATAAARLLLDYARHQLALKRVTALTLEINPASARVLEKLGFTRVRSFVDCQGMCHQLGDVILEYERRL